MKPAVLSRMERYFKWAGTKDHKAKDYGLRLIAEVRRLQNETQTTGTENGNSKLGNVPCDHEHRDDCLHRNLADWM